MMRLNTVVYTVVHCFALLYTILKFCTLLYTFHFSSFGLVWYGLVKLTGHQNSINDGISACGESIEGSF